MISQQAVSAHEQDVSGNDQAVFANAYAYATVQRASRECALHDSAGKRMLAFAAVGYAVLKNANSRKKDVPLPKILQGMQESQRITFRITRHTLTLAVPNEQSELQLDYRPVVVKSGISMAANLREAFRESPLLERDYKRATVLVDTPVVLVPVEEFREEEAQAIYTYTVNTKQQDTVLHCVLPDEKSVALFSINKDLKLVLDDHFSDLKCRPLMYGLWNRMHTMSLSSNTKRLFAYMHEGKLEIAAFEKNRFRFCNAFNGARLNDAVYFLLFVWQQLGFDALQHELHLMGTLTEQEKMLEILRRYIKKVYYHNATAMFHRAPMTGIKGIQADMLAHFIKHP